MFTNLLLFLKRVTQVGKGIHESGRGAENKKSSAFFPSFCHDSVYLFFLKGDHFIWRTLHFSQESKYFKRLTIANDLYLPRRCIEVGLQGIIVKLYFLPSIFFLRRTAISATKDDAKENDGFHNEQNNSTIFKNRKIQYGL